MKKHVTIFIIACILLTLLVGCGGAQSSVSQDEAEAQAVEEQNGAQVETAEDISSASEADAAEAPAEAAPEMSGEPTSEEPEVYTVRFDLNSTPDDITDDETFEYEVEGWSEDWTPIVTTEESIVTVPVSETAYLAEAIPAPERDGYAFAGWQTRPVVTEDDLINGVSPYMWMFGTQSLLGFPADAMYIKDMESLDENNTATLYARWVEVKDISTAEELRAIGNDLYGAYRLTADIELDDAWEPIGRYFTNYELYNTDWWTYAFRGSFDGNGHTISGLAIHGAKVSIEGYDANTAVWHDDGDSADGCAAMFGAIAGAEIRDLTLEAPVVDIAGDFRSHGDHIYASPVAAFDMGSTLVNVTVNDPEVTILASDEESVHLPAIYVAASGLVGGGWSDTITGCTVNGGTIQVDAETLLSHGGDIYVGGVVGECYSFISDCASTASILVDVEDSSEAPEDTMLSVRVGGLNGSSTDTTANTVEASISVSVSKPDGGADVSIGGLAGTQIYQTASGNDIRADIITACALDDELGRLNTGAVIGAIDPASGLQILMYAPESAVGCSGNSTAVTVNGEQIDTLIAALPELNGEALEYIAMGDHEIAEGVTLPSNAEAVIEKYGSLIPEFLLQDGIIWITVE